MKGILEDCNQHLKFSYKGLKFFSLRMEDTRRAWHKARHHNSINLISIRGNDSQQSFLELHNKDFHTQFLAFSLFHKCCWVQSQQS
jgi:hypothetical protein